MGKAKHSLLLLAAFVLSIGLAFQALPVYAGESYGSHYAGGNEDFMAGALPPAGTNIYINYLVYEDIGSLKNNVGGTATYGVRPNGLSLNTGIQVLVNAARFVRVTKIKVLGGDLVLHVIVPFGEVHASNAVVLPANLGTAYAPGFPASAFSLGDIEWGAGIAWHHSPTLHSVFAVDVVAPTGGYQASPVSGTGSRAFVVNPADLGRNYWSIDPLYAFTYLGDKNSPLPGFEFSAKMMYWINTVNTATSYISGQEFSADYLVGYHINKELAFGANGFILYQTTKDKQFGQTAFDPLTGLQTGVLGREFSVGPAMTYEIPHGCLTFKFQHDVSVANRPQADKFWLKWIYAW